MEGGLDRDRAAPHEATPPPSVVHDFEGIRVDTSDWPLLVLEMPGEPVSDDAVRAALAHLEGIMARTPAGTRFFQVSDLSRMTRFAPASHRRYAGEWTRRTAQLALRTRLGGVIVAPSPMLRAILTAMFWTQGSRTPAHVVSSRAEGVLRGLRALEIERAPLPPHLLALRARLEPPPARAP